MKSRVSHLKHPRLLRIFYFRIGWLQKSTLIMPLLKFILIERTGSWKYPQSFPTLAILQALCSISANTHSTLDIALWVMGLCFVLRLFPCMVGFFCFLNSPGLTYPPPHPSFHQPFTGFCMLERQHANEQDTKLHTLKNDELPDHTETWVSIYNITLIIK